MHTPIPAISMPPMQSPEQIADGIIKQFGTLIYAHLVHKERIVKIESWRACLNRIAGPDLKPYHFKDSRFRDIQNEFKRVLKSDSQEAQKK